MSNHYRKLFLEPGTRSFTAAGLLARMPLSMVGIGIITMISATQGSYSLAGALTGTYAVSAALSAPQIARLVDRHGQRRIIPATALFSATALSALLLVSASDGPIWLMFATSALAGITPSAPALVRARWTQLYRGTPQLHTAYSWETVLDEASFILGPPLSIGLSVALFPQAGPLVAGAFLLLGIFWLATQRRTEPPPKLASSSGTSPSALKHPTVAMITGIMVALGTIIGTVDVVSVAFAEHRGTPAAASIVLVAYAVGSCVSGFTFGMISLKRSTRQLLSMGLLATAVTVLPLMWVSTITMLAITVFVSGVFFAPTMILAARLIEETVAEKTLTESLTWSTAGLGFGTAVGPAVTGPIIDLYGSSSGFWVTTVVAALLSLFAFLLRTAHRIRPGL